MIAILDYGAGNLHSVQNALERLGGITFFVSRNPEELQKAEKILFPGVGHAQSAMQELQKNGLDMFLQTTQKPVLGICLGMQLLFDSSEEGSTHCLQIIPGKNIHFSQEKKRVPHIGWNTINVLQESVLFADLSLPLDFYFAHSYIAQPKSSEYVLAQSTYIDEVFPTAVQYKNFFGVQFHPEKSGKIGESILKNFIALAT